MTPRTTPHSSGTETRRPRRWSAIRSTAVVLTLVVAILSSLALGSTSASAQEAQEAPAPMLLDLDSLLQDLFGPTEDAEAPGPDGLDLDSLLQDLFGPTEDAEAPGPDGLDLDSLLQDLFGPTEDAELAELLDPELLAPDLLEALGLIDPELLDPELLGALDLIDPELLDPELLGALDLIDPELLDPELLGALGLIDPELLVFLELLPAELLDPDLLPLLNILGPDVLDTEFLSFLEDPELVDALGLLDPELLADADLMQLVDLLGPDLLDEDLLGEDLLAVLDLLPAELLVPELPVVDFGDYVTVNDLTAPTFDLPVSLACGGDDADTVEARFVFEATSHATQITTTDDGVAINVTPVDGGPLSCNGIWAHVPEEIRDNVLGPIAGLPGNVELDENFIFPSIPGELYAIEWISELANEGFTITEAAVAPPVTVTVSCLAGNGRIDVNIVNPADFTAPYEVSIGDRITRSRTLDAGERGRVAVTGRTDGAWSVTIASGDATLLQQEAVVDCDNPAPSPAPADAPEVQVIPSCLDSGGFVFFQFLNQAAESTPWIIEFEGVNNRSTTAAAHGAAVRGVSGRPDGEYDFEIRSKGRVVMESSLTVSCD